MDKIGAFIEACCVMGEEFRAPSSDVYKAFRSWCEDNGERAMGHRKFTQALEERGIRKGRTKTHRLYIGIGLLADDEDPDDEPDDGFDGPVQADLDV
jgi:putative DNA primase/helicase